MGFSRHRYEVFLLKTVCRLTSIRSAVPAEPDLYRTRILSGFVRGMYFSMPQLERLSFALGTYESHVVRCMQRFMKSGDVAYDIGANAGYFTLVMSKIARTTGKVFSFEPDPKNYRALMTNILNNGLKNAVAFQKAVSDTTGIVTFATFEYSLVGHIATAKTPEDAKLIQVKSVSLDDFVYTEGFPSPNLIKIDVEGAEDQVILGADRLLREAKPVILAEVREGATYQRIIEFLRSHDYRYEFLRGGWQREKHHLGDMLFIPNAHS